MAAQSRKKEAFIAADDTITFEQESIWDGENWLLLSTTAFEYDEQKRVVRTTRGNGRSSSTTWMCCGKLSETDEDGITTSYGYNSAHQLVEVIRSEVKDGDVVVTPETITTYTHDAAGRTLTTRRDIGAMTTTESTVFDVLGRITSQTDILGRVTTTHYSEDGLTTTVITPAGATIITTRHADGSLTSEGGTGQRALVYEYNVQDNLLCTMVMIEDKANTQLSHSLTDGFGQTVQKVQSTTTGAVLSIISEYNAKGQLVKQYLQTLEPAAAEDAETLNPIIMSPTFFEYDSFGNLTNQTLALTEIPDIANSPVYEFTYALESTDEGVFSYTTQTRYNAASQPLASTQKQLISQLSTTLVEKVITHMCPKDFLKG